MNTPLVSIVLAVKNGERYLAEAIKSVLAQTFKSYEIIVVDDNSTDNTLNIINSYSQVGYIFNKGKGTSHARNVGIDAATGKFIAFQSHDDIWTPDKLSTQVDYMAKHPDIQYTIAKMKFFLEDGHSPPSGFRRELLSGNHIGMIPETLLVRKTLFSKIGKFDPEYDVAEDVDWFARANDANVPMAIIPKILLHKRIHNTNKSSNVAKNNLDLLKLLRKSIERKREQNQEKE
jgi:glycosyltransferase involved in cell wall biosynthesis